MLRMNDNQRPRWQNWAGTAFAQPAAIEQPATTEEVVELVHRARQRGQRVKAVGSGHSFTGIAVTDGILLDLGRLTGVISTDAVSCTATVRAGTVLRDMNQQLWRSGLAMANLGDIDQQTLSGSLATGTHGTGAQFPGLAAAVLALKIVLADGTLVDCDDSRDPDLFAAARIGLGALGIITEITLQCVPAFLLQAVEAPDRLGAVMECIDSRFDESDHFEFYWFPHTDRVLTKSNTRLPLESGGRPLPRWRAWLDDEFLSNQVFEVVNRTCSRWPAAVPAINSVSSRALSARTFTAPSFEVFASSRRVRFREMEVAIPRESLPYVQRELTSFIERSDLRLPFPVEFRCAPADDVWLSTAYQRDSAYVAIHQYHRMDHGEYFDAFESITRSVGGRPHWGKLHSLGYAQLTRSVPRLDDFRRVRNRVDPDRVFSNDYLHHVLGD
jgi:FAD-linked oxidoreductase